LNKKYFLFKPKIYQICLEFEKLVIFFLVLMLS